MRGALSTGGYCRPPATDPAALLPPGRPLQRVLFGPVPPLPLLPLMIGPLGMQEMLIILVVALIVFGPRRLPQIGKTLGKSLAEFRRTSNELRNTLEREVQMEEFRAARNEVSGVGKDIEGNLREGLDPTGGAPSAKASAAGGATRAPSAKAPAADGAQPAPSSTPDEEAGRAPTAEGAADAAGPRESAGDEERTPPRSGAPGDS